MIDLKILKTVEALKGLNNDQLATIQKCSEKMEFNQGERLFTEGEDSAHLWIVLEGEVELRNDRPQGQARKFLTIQYHDEGAKQIGVDAFVYKPFTKPDLAKAIRQVLDINRTTAA